jgi:adenine-specific DNA-methyltransferase
MGLDRFLAPLAGEEKGGLFPKTRYLGAKRRVLPALEGLFAGLEFDSALDAFGGTGAVSYALKRLGKAVTYNDLLTWNYEIGRALIENDEETLAPDAAAALLSPEAGRAYRSHVAENFRGVFYTAEEDREIDRAIQNSRRLPGYAGDIARYALYQACLIKRPYNLFHRANLGLRTAEVARSFGNKRSWDRPFADYLPRFAEEANRAVFRGARPCRASRGEAERAPGEFDLVYADPPYVSSRGVGVDYAGFYHFLEGLARYDEWPAQIDHRLRHRPLIAEKSPWSDPARIGAAFDALFARFERSIMVVSYRSDGTPPPEELSRKLARYKRRVEVTDLGGLTYALSTRSPNSRELVFIGR